MSPKLSQTEDLYLAILSLDNMEEAKKFFRDLLTKKEIEEMGKRWRAAKMLYSNIPYSAIIEQTGLSSTTVARISKWLNNGKGGYYLMLNKTRQ